MTEIEEIIGLPRYKLHLGCGNVYKPGFVNIDIQQNSSSDVDLVADVTNLPLPDNTVEVIESYHLIEHLSRPEFLKALPHWYKLLVNGGRFIAELPDFEKVVGQYLIGKKEYIEHIFGNQTTPWQFHKWGYDFKSLKKDLEAVGFKDVVLKEATDYHTDDEPCFRIEATKMARRQFHLEATNICSREGRRCSYCSDTDTRKKGFMDITLAGTILSQIDTLNPEKKEILLFLSGEPLLHPQIGELIVLANKVGDSVIHTNADVLTEEKSLQIINAGLTRIFINLHNRPDIGTVPPETLANIKHFLGLNDHTIETHLQKIIPLPDNLPNEEELRKEFPGIDYIDFRRPHSWAKRGSVKGADEIPNDDFHTCSFLANNMAINWEGKVHLCCACLNDERIIGDLTKEMVRDVDLKLDNLYKQQLDKEIISVCSGCERYSVLQNDK